MNGVRSDGAVGKGPLLLFDLDDTLIDRSAAFRHWADGWALHHSLGPDAAAWLVEADDDSDRPRAELFAAAAGRFSLPMPVGALVDEFRREISGHFEPDPVVLAGLAELRRVGWRIGVVTNGSTAQRPKRVAKQLIDCVHAVCGAEEIGVGKPEPGIFHAAAKAAGAMLANGWMVGDSPSSDIAGGTGVGLRTIWISRGRDWPLEDIEPTVTVPTGHDALAYLLDESTQSR